MLTVWYLQHVETNESISGLVQFPTKPHHKIGYAENLQKKVWQTTSILWKPPHQHEAAVEMLTVLIIMLSLLGE